MTTTSLSQVKLIFFAPIMLALVFILACGYAYRLTDMLAVPIMDYVPFTCDQLLNP